MFSSKGGTGFELRIGVDHGLQRFLMASIAAIMIRMVAAQQMDIALPQSPPVRIRAEAEDAQRLAVAVAELAAVMPRAFGGGAAEAHADRV